MRGQLWALKPLEHHGYMVPRIQKRAPNQPPPAKRNQPTTQPNSKIAVCLEFLARLPPLEEDLRGFFFHRICFCKYFHRICFCKNFHRICFCKNFHRICFCKIFYRICFCKIFYRICFCKIFYRICFCKIFYRICFCKIFYRICFCKIILYTKTCLTAITFFYTKLASHARDFFSQNCARVFCCALYAIFFSQKIPREKEPSFAFDRLT